MYCLFLDLSFEDGQVALFDDEKPVLSRTFKTLQCISPHVEIEALLQSLSLSISSISILAVASGPGSYTGLRNAAAVIKTLAYVFRLPIVPVSSLLLGAPKAEACLDFASDSCRIALVEDARISGAYVQKIVLSKEDCFTSVAPPELVSLASLEERLHSVDVIASRSGQDSWYARGVPILNRVRWIAARECNLRALGRHLMEEYRSGRSISWQELQIAYLRKSQAELEQIERQKLKNVVK